MSAAAPRTDEARAHDPGPKPWGCGLLAVDKPEGMTSHDVVEVVRRRLRVRPAGHLGTLDPAAGGLLLVALGAATRFIPVWQGGEKTYEGVVRFGIVTSTQDLQGEVLERHDAVPDPAAILEASLAFLGESSQVPPMASALKVGGERLYRMHRRGEVVEREPRRIEVRSWEWLAFAPPDATFRVRCSGGTYIRTLAHDLGRALGSGAALAALRRVRSEPFGLERSVRPSRVESEPQDAVWEAAGLTLEQAVAHLPTLRLEEFEANELGYGRRPSIALARARNLPLSAGPRSVVIAGSSGTVLGLGELAPVATDAVSVRPHVLLPWALREGRAGSGDRAP
ncbi:MAG: tRNA pseudouridine(55) synthase TruB [Candidatus Eisenbacteria bacterium]|nr:tRNA pseudouridine(55) synthase TruB [Candidatus Eisenbacteria bacterium]